MSSTMSLFDNATMDEFNTKAKVKRTVSDKTSVRASILLELLYFEKSGMNYASKPSQEIPMLKKLNDKLTRKEIYCLIWTVAYTPPVIKGSNAALALRYIVYHAGGIMETEEYKEMLHFFDDDAIIRIEERIDGYFKSKHTE